MDYISAKTDPVSRNLFLENYKSYVLKVASAHCRRGLQWGRDEELSIAMIALDSAIDVYQPQKGAGFETFASVVIKRRLIDYQRRMHRRKEREVYAEDIPHWQQPDARQNDEFLRLERAAELEEFAGMLGQFGVSFTDLAKESPRQQDVRKRLLRAARIIAAEPDLVAQVLEKGRLPLEQMAELTGETKKVLANRRRYLLALLAVTARSEDFPFISTYLGIGRGENE